MDALVTQNTARHPEGQKKSDETKKGDASRLTIAALVVTHNRIEKLRLTVSRLLAEDLDYILVFDNHSSDGTSEWLEMISSSRLIAIKSSKNLGGAGGFSRGLRHLVQRFDPDWIVVMDDDGRPFPDCIRTFRNLPSNNEWDAIGAAVLMPSGKVCEMNRPYRNPFWHLREFFQTLMGGGRRGFHLSDAAYDPQADPVAVDMASFVGLFLSRNAIMSVGYPDERLFIYGDDQIYTLNLRRNGARIGFFPQIRFEHDTTSIQGGGHLVLHPTWKVYYNYRNAILAYKVAAGPLFWLIFPLLMVKWFRHAQHYAEEKSTYRRVLKQAIKDGLLRRLDRPHDEVMALSSGSV